MKKQLPNKLSALMRIALADLAKVERTKYIGVDMSVWITLEHLIDEGSVVRDNRNVIDMMKQINDSEQCTVCFAGSVMAYSLDAARFDDLSMENCHKMAALNYVREGEVRTALMHLYSRNQIGVWLERHDVAIPVTHYEDDKKQWRKDMWSIVRKLERLDL